MAQGQGSAELSLPLAVPLAVSPGRMVSGWGMIPAGAVLALLLSEQLGLEQSCWFLSTW